MAGFTKADVRAWSRRLGLRTWDKPAAACLASRVPYGTPVTFTTLDAVARAESGLRALGFRQLRVRHYGDTARIEVPEADIAEVVARREAVSAAVHAAGYHYVTLDLDGFRSGNLNDSLAAGGHQTSRGDAMIGVRVQADLPRGARPRAGHRPDDRAVRRRPEHPQGRRGRAGRLDPLRAGRRCRASSTRRSTGSGPRASRSTSSATSSRADPWTAGRRPSRSHAGRSHRGGRTGQPLVGQRRCRCTWPRTSTTSRAGWPSGVGPRPREVDVLGRRDRPRPRPPPVPLREGHARLGPGRRTRDRPRLLRPAAIEAARALADRAGLADRADFVCARWPRRSTSSVADVRHRLRQPRGAVLAPRASPSGRPRSPRCSGPAAVSSSTRCTR